MFCGYISGYYKWRGKCVLCKNKIERIWELKICKCFYCFLSFSLNIVVDMQSSGVHWIHLNLKVFQNVDSQTHSKSLEMLLESFSSDDFYFWYISLNCEVATCSQNEFGNVYSLCAALNKTRFCWFILAMVTWKQSNSCLILLCMFTWCLDPTYSHWSHCD